MLNTNQPPYIYEYYVRTINIATDPMTGKQSLIMATVAEEAVNAIDIQDVLRRPRTFITGWLEAHPYQKAYTGGIAPVPYKAEHFKKQENPLNVLLMAVMQKLYTHAAEAEGSVTIPPIRSLEKIMLDAGWEFNIQCVGDDEIEPHVADNAIWEAVKNSKEYALLKQHNMLGDAIAEPTTAPAPTPISPVAPQPEIAQVEQRQNELECKLDRLTSMLEMVLNANNNSAGRREGRAATAKRKADYDVSDDADEGRPALSVVKQGAPGDLPAG